MIPDEHFEISCSAPTNELRAVHHSYMCGDSQFIERFAIWQQDSLKDTTVIQYFELKALTFSVYKPPETPVSPNPLLEAARLRVTRRHGLRFVQNFWEIRSSV